MVDSMRENVLIVEDDEGIAYLQRQVLQRAGYRVTTVATEEEAREHLAAAPVDLMILDYRLSPQRTGLDLYADLKLAGIELPAIMVTGFGDEAVVVRALRAGVRDFVSKSNEYLDYLPEAVERVASQIRLERRLADSEARLHAFMNHSPAVTYIKDSDGRLLYANKRFEQLFPSLPWQGRIVEEILPTEAARQVRENDQKVLTTGCVGEFVESVLLPNGQLTHWLFYKFPIENTAGPPLLGAMALDITERIRAEQALRDSEARFRCVTESATDAIVAADGQGNIISWNEGAERIFGYTASEVVGQPVAMLMPERYRAAHRAGLKQATARGGASFLGQAVELCGLRQDGSEFPLEMCLGSWQTGAQVFYSAIIRDISERKRAAEILRERDNQLRQSQKMEAIGTLAGGVAHEFNNLLQAIQGYTRYAMEGLDEDDERYKDLQQVIQAGDRATTLTRQLLGFSRRDVLQMADIEPNSLICSLMKMIRPLIGEHIKIEITLDENVGTVHADAGHLQQMLMNLCVNARDAMPKGGQLTIKSQDVCITKEYCDFHTDMKPGRYLLLTVADTGCGIPADVREHIFEPFFTTKEVGKGTGLGLAMVYGMVQQHEGAIWVYSEPGIGTTFRVYFPTIERHTAAEKATEHERASGGSETILIAEDDPMVRELAVRILERAGYQTITAADGEDAVRVFEENMDRISLALLDVVMPRMGGRDAFQKMKSIKPTVQAIFCSGYDPATAQVGFVLDDDLRLIQKPFDPELLLTTIREVLDLEPCQAIT